MRFDARDLLTVASHYGCFRSVMIQPHTPQMLEDLMAVESLMAEDEGEQVATALLLLHTFHPRPPKFWTYSITCHQDGQEIVASC